MLADMPTALAQGVRDVEGQVIAARLHRGVQQLAILLLGQMLVEVDMAGRASIEVSCEVTPMELQLIQHIDSRIFHPEEIAVVAIARDAEFIGAIPRGILHTLILGRNHLSIEHDSLRSGALVGLVDGLKNSFGISNILRIFRVNRNAQCFRTFDEAVDANS